MLELVGAIIFWGLLILLGLYILSLLADNL